LASSMLTRNISKMSPRGCSWIRKYKCSRKSWLANRDCRPPEYRSPIMTVDHQKKEALPKSKQLQHPNWSKSYTHNGCRRTTRRERPSPKSKPLQHPKWSNNYTPNGRRRTTRR
jgi:hypothetical protein